MPRSIPCPIALMGLAGSLLSAQTVPTVSVPDLQVRVVASGLNMPTTMVFVGATDFLVLEKDSGKVWHYQENPTTGAIERSEALDLGVNNAVERGLLGIAMHPGFPAERSVYIFWTCRTTNPGTETTPPQEFCAEPPATGEDTPPTPAESMAPPEKMLSVPLKGHRLDRFTWTGGRLTYDRNILTLRSFQADGALEPQGQGDEGQPPAANHNGGVIGFGTDGKLYVYFGDQGRRGWMQNLPNGPTGPGLPDDQFGGPEPDDEHLAGVILRLNPDGTAPEDNPFFGAGATLREQAGANNQEAGTNLQKVFAYGLRNGFGMTVDPATGRLWITEHGDDTFDEINLVNPGFNGGWVQVAGPLNRIAEFKALESTIPAQSNPTTPSLQQWRWPPSRIADSGDQARSRMYPLGQYIEPQFSWRYATLPGALGFAPQTFGRDVTGDLLVAVVGDPMTAVGYLLRFELHPNRRALRFNDAELRDRVADNNAKYDLTETQSLIVGSGFGIATDMKLSSRNTVYVVSHSNGAIYEVSRSGGQHPDDDDPDIGGVGPLLRATLTPVRNAPQNGSGSVAFRLNSGEEVVCFDMNLSNVSSATEIGIYQGTPGENETLLFRLPTPTGIFITGCTAVPRDTIRALRVNPRGHFVTIRTEQAPFGAVQGRFE